MILAYLGDNGSVHNQKWIDAIRRNGKIEIHVISFNKGIKFENVHYHFIKKMTGTKADYLLNVFAVRKILNKIKPDIVHAHYATSQGFLAALTGFHPMIITGWGSDIFDAPQNPLLKGILKYSLKKADVITVLSKITLREMKKLTPKKVELIPFGVDINYFSPQEKPNDGKFRIGTIRTLEEKYGVEYLIRAFAILYPKYVNCYLEIVGDGKLRNSLEQLCVDLKISDRVVFYGYVNQKKEPEKYIRILGSLDVFCILSILDSETFGVAAVEASACGLPVVASNIGGLPEVVLDGNTGIIVQPKNAEETAAAIEKLIQNKELGDTYGINGRKFIVENYDWNKNLEKMFSIYNSLLR